jgi:hypothetical protein
MRQTRRMAQPASESRPLTVDEAVELYPNEWMLMRVTDQGQGDGEFKGVIVAHRKTRRGIQNTAMKTFMAAKQSGERHYLFFGFRRFRTLADWQAAVGKDFEPEPTRWAFGG